MTTDDVRIRSAIRDLVQSAPPPAPFPAERRHRRPSRGRVVLAAATVLVLGTIALVLPRSGNAETGTLVLAPRDGAQTDRFSLIDLDTRAVRDVRLPGLSAWGVQVYPLVHTQGRFVYLEPGREGQEFPDPEGGLRVFSYPDDLRGKRMTLGRADFIVPSGRRGYVWLHDAVIARVGDSFIRRAVVREVDVATGKTGREWRLDGEPLVGYGRGLLVKKDDDELVLWTPGGEGAERTIVSSQGPLLYGGIQGDTALVGFDCDTPHWTCAGVRLIDVRTGRWRDVKLPAFADRWVVPQQFISNPLSPNETHLVLPVIADDATRVVMDIHGRVLQRFDDVAASSLWSEDGRWVIIQKRKSIVAYRLEDGTTRTVPAKYQGEALSTLPR